jgi:isopenicillin-N epimerase
MDLIQPLQVSWGWHPDRQRLDERDDCGSTPRLRALEFEGTRDICPWLAVPAAIDFQEEIGLERIRHRIADLTGVMRQRLDGVAGLQRVTPAAAELHGALTAFRLPPGSEAPVLRARLWDEHRIEAPIIERPDGLLIRVSTHFYNTEAEIERLRAALETTWRR